MKSETLLAILGLLVAALSTGTALGYWLKTRIDDRRSDRTSKRQYRMEDLRKQRELLLEFLGKPRAEFITLHGVGHTWDESWRRGKADSIAEWVETYRPHFPTAIQKHLNQIAAIAGTMVLGQTIESAQRRDVFVAAQEALESLEAYLGQITSKLT